MSYTLEPAYGRDYKSKAEVEADLAKGNMFLATGHGAAGFLLGRNLSLEDLQRMGETQASMRYAKLRKQFIYKVPA